MHKFVLLLFLFLHEIYGRAQWTPDQAFAWFNSHKYIMGTEYMTSSAVNSLEMWQAETFDPVLIDKEMAVGGQLGMTTMRIFLEDLVYSHDPAGFKNRMSTLVGIMSKYGIKPLFVFFTNGPITNPVIGKQPKPRPGKESSAWARTPSANVLGNQTLWPALQAYVTDIVGTYANDSRVLGWDMWNEPDDGIDFNALMSLFPQVCDWARSMNPIQPVTSGLFHDDLWRRNRNYSAFELMQINNSDIISFHEYADPGSFEAAIKRLQQWGRPLIATEYMARTLDSFFLNTLSLGKKYNIGMISWGLVNGKTQFNLDWSSGGSRSIVSPPTVWFQDILRQDRSPYLLEEAHIMKRLNGCPLGYHSNVNNWTCYNAYDTLLSFSDAQTVCKNTWSNLVTISNAFENSDLRTYVSSNFSTCDKFYIGLYNKNSAKWVWPMTTPYNNPAYRNWKSRYPVSDSSSNCVVLNQDGTWANQPCTTPQCYICSY